MKPKAAQLQENIETETKKLPDSANPEEKYVAEAKSLYLTYCVQCHGEDGAMGYSGAKNLKETLLSDSEISALISKGRGAMPEFPQLKDEDKAKIISYVRGFNK